MIKSKQPKTKGVSKMAKNMLYAVRIENMARNNTGSNGKISSFIISNGKEIENMTLSEFAEKSGVGYATACRFFKSLGLSGFKEFKQLVLHEMSSNPEEMNINMLLPTENDSFGDINKRICEYSASIVSNCGKLLTEEMIEHAVDLLQKARRIHFIGVGTSAVTAGYAYTKFFRVKQACSFDRDPIIAKMRSAKLGEGDLLFAISSSGRTKSIIENARIARKRKADVISICDFIDSPLSQLSSAGICTTVRESNKFIDVDFPLIQGQITLIDVLYACLSSRLSSKVNEGFETTRNAVSEDKF